MRLAIIADIHANAVAFEAVVADLKRQSPDAVVCLGDVVLKGPRPQECVDLLRSLAPLAVVRGNNDHLMTRWPFPGYSPAVPKHEAVRLDYEYTVGRLAKEDEEWLGALPLTQTLRLEGLQVELFHASPRSVDVAITPWTPLDELCALAAEPDTKLVLLGHLHHAYARQARGVQVVNPGAISLSCDWDNRAAYALVDLEGGNTAVQLRRVAYDVEAAIAVARQAGMPELEAFAFGLRTGKYPYDTRFW